MRLFASIFIVMSWLPYSIDEPMLYYSLNALLHLVCVALIFKYESKNVVNLILAAGIICVTAYDFIDYSIRLLGVSTGDNFSKFIAVDLALIVYVAIFRNRYKWQRLKSDDYNPSIVQRIYSKPDKVITLLGAATSLSPKCSVRYSYNGQTVRFKRNSDYPILCNTVIKPTDIVEDSEINPETFYSRFEEVKHRKYNLLKFNCRSLF